MTTSLWFFASLLVVAAAIEDWEETTDGGWEFIYHDRYDLLLTLHENNCYYTYIRDSSQDENRYLIRHRADTEKHIQNLVATSSGTIQPSSMDAVQAKFHDILADFECSGHTVYIVEIDLNSIHIDHGGFLSGIIG